MKQATVSPLRTTRPPTKQPSAPLLSWWAAMAEAWDLLRLDPAPMEPVRSTLARHEAALAERDAAHQTAATTQRQLRHDIARGETTYEAAAKEYALATAVLDLTDHSKTPRLPVILANDITTTMRQVGDELIVEHLAPAFAAVVEQATTLAPLVADVEDEKEAMRAAPEVRDAWGRLLALDSQARDLRKLAHKLRSEHITAVSPGAFDVEYEYRHPDRVTSVNLVSLINNKADPYIGTAAEVGALEAARGEKSLRIPPAPTRIVRRDSSIRPDVA